MQVQTFFRHFQSMDYCLIKTWWWNNQISKISNFKKACFAEQYVLQKRVFISPTKLPCLHGKICIFMTNSWNPIPYFKSRGTG